MCNHKKDNIPAFSPSEMLRSYNNARPVFDMFDAGKNISYQFFVTFKLKTRQVY